MGERTGLLGLPSFGDNDYPNILGFLNDPQIEVTSEEGSPRAVAGPAEEDLRNLIAARKVHDCFRSIIAFQDSRLDMQVSREVQVLFDCFTILL